MADGRMLKKNVSKSRRLADLNTDSARLLWTWLLPHLDVEGRFEADPNIIKGAVVPRIDSLTPAKISEILDDLVRVGLIYVYEHDGDKYLEYRKFKDFQRLRDGKEKASEIPPCPDEIRNRPWPSHEQDCPRAAHGRPMGGPQDAEGAGKIREDKIREDNIYPQSKPRKSPRSSPEYSESFLEFYSIYPRKEGKKEAFDAWRKLDLTNGLKEKIFKAISAQGKYRKVLAEKDQFVPEWPYPATWLNGRRWEDEIESEKSWAEKRIEKQQEGKYNDFA